MSPRPLYDPPMKSAALGTMAAMKGKESNVAVLFNARFLLLAVVTSAFACSNGGRQAASSPAPPFQETPNPVAKAMKIKMTMGSKIATATLDDSESARDFASLLPLKLSLRDHNSTEKIAYLPRKLSTAGAPEGIDPSAGDLAYYAPWGNLAIFYNDFEYSKGLIRLGRIDSDLDVIAAADSGEIAIELME